MRFIYSIIMMVLFIGAISCLEDATLQWTESSYFPSPISVVVGQKVVWKSTDQDKHEIVIINENTRIPMSQGNDAVHVFKKPGWYSYTCSVHPTKKFYVKVNEEATADRNVDQMAEAVKEMEVQQRMKSNARAYEKREMLYKLQQAQARQESQGVSVKEGPYGNIPQQFYESHKPTEAPANSGSGDNNNNNGSGDQGSNEQQPTNKPTRPPRSTPPPVSSSEGSEDTRQNTGVKPGSGSTPKPTTKPETNTKPSDTKDPLGTPKPTKPKTDSADKNADETNDQSGSGSKNSSSTVTYSFVFIVLSSAFVALFI